MQRQQLSMHLLLASFKGLYLATLHNASFLLACSSVKGHMDVDKLWSNNFGIFCNFRCYLSLSVLLLFHTQKSVKTSESAQSVLKFRQKLFQIKYVDVTMELIICCTELETPLVACDYVLAVVIISITNGATWSIEF